MRKIRQLLIGSTLVCSCILLPAIVHALDECHVAKPIDGCITVWDANGALPLQKKISRTVSNHILITDKEADAFDYVEFEFGMIRETALPSVEIMEEHWNSPAAPFQTVRPLWAGAAKDIQAGQSRAAEGNGDPGMAAAKAAVVTVRGGKGHGSGFLVSPNGFIITNAHVIFGTGDKPAVRFLNGTEKPAELVKIDNLRDLALLKVECSKCPYLPMGDSERVNVGDAVVAVGTPLALKNEGMVTAGKVKGKHSIHGIGKGFEFIESSILTAPGNSGGPLLNRERRVVGVNSLSNFISLARYYAHTGKLLADKFAGCASPVNEVKRFIDR